MSFKNFNFYKGLSRIIETTFWVVVALIVVISAVAIKDNGLSALWFPIVMIGFAYIVKLVIYYIIDGFANKD